LAADQGYSKAQSNLGYMYLNGLGVERDYEKALYWYQLAVDQGSSFAQSKLGSMYEEGHGVERDYEKALYWFQLATEQGDNIAQKHLIHFLLRWSKTGLDQYIKKIESKCQKLEEENTELKYRPGGIGYKECKDRFDKQDY